MFYVSSGFSLQRTKNKEIKCSLLQKKDCRKKMNETGFTKSFLISVMQCGNTKLMDISEDLFSESL